MANEDSKKTEICFCPLGETGTTSAEFLSRIPKKTDLDHIEDLKKMRALADKIGRNISLNPAIDLETAITNTKNLNEKATI